MTITENIKTIDNKIKQIKAQCHLDNQTATISALSLGNVSEYKFLADKVVLPEKELLEKAVTMKRFKYSPLDKELKAETDIEKKTLKLNDNFGFAKIIKKKNQQLKTIINQI